MILLVITAFINVIGFSVNFAERKFSMDPVTFFNLPLLQWVTVFDMGVAVFITIVVVAKVLVKLIDIMITQCFTSVGYSIALMIKRYKISVMVLLWGTILFFSIPPVLKSLEFQGDMHILDPWIFCSFIIGGAWGIKCILLHVLEEYLYSNVTDGINKLSAYEQIIVKLLNSESKLFGFNPLAFLKQMKEATSTKDNTTINNLLFKKKKKTLIESANKTSKKLMERYDTALRGYLEEHDLRKNVTVSESKEIFKFLDRNHDGIVTSQELVDSLRKLNKDMKSLVLMQRSRMMLYEVIDRILTVVYIILVFLAVLVVFQVDIESFLIVIGSSFMALSWAYGRTMQDFFDSMNMLFFVHPFDIGDKITMDDGPILVVESVGIFTTYFLSVEGYGVYVNNAQLSQSRLSNLSKGEGIRLTIEFQTIATITKEQVAKLHSEGSNASFPTSSKSNCIPM
eukprot:TRINITY_DN6663_c0_g1_i2.p1 TRINITY_DN6663_c0_g1~~TRINITY_DN6663_c0_g1_i2.p1  ORF type:complete len:454 (-),score=122.14 TRINITY_DN6663_c0_g1_i2:916-2277(-)